MFGGCQDAPYGFKNIACQGQDRDRVEGTGHGLPVLHVPVPQLAQQFLVHAYLAACQETCIRVRFRLVTAN
jgi:hypothetical protein